MKGAITMTDMMIIKGRKMQYPIKIDEIFFEMSIVDSWYLQSLLEREATRRNQKTLYFSIIKEDGKLSYRASFKEVDFHMVLLNIAEIQNKSYTTVYENYLLET